MLEGDRSTGRAGLRRADQVAQRTWRIELERAARRDARLGRLIRGAPLERLRSCFVARYTELRALSRSERRRILRRWAQTIGVPALLMALATPPARSATYNVIGFGDGPGLIVPAGADTFTATTLRGAIMAANVSEGVADVINLQAGVYVLSTGGSLDITDDLQINGAGRAQTIIDAAAIGDRVFDISATDVVGFTGFALGDGFVDDGTAQGAGIRNDGADLTLTGVAVLDNVAAASANEAYGGGIYSNGGALVIIDSLIINNQAQGDPGGGSAGVGSDGVGGGIYFKTSAAASLTIVNSIIAGNMALGGTGGGVSGTGGDAFGGGIAIDGVGSSTSITACAITGNQAVGGVANTDGSGHGGGIYTNGTATVTHSTLSDNSAFYGGGIEYGGGTVTVTWSTFSGNAAPGTGGGIFSLSGAIHLAGNLFEAGASGDNCVVPSTLVDNGYNLSSDASCFDGGTGSAAPASLNLGSQLDGTLHPPTIPSDGIGAIPNGTSLDNNGVTLACDGTITDQIGQARPILAGEPCNAGAVETVLLPIVFEDGFESGNTSAWSSSTP